MYAMKTALFVAITLILTAAIIGLSEPQIIGNYTANKMVSGTKPTTCNSGPPADVWIDNATPTAPVLNVCGTSGFVALAGLVGGVLPVTSGGTGVTTSTGSGSTVLSTSPTFSTGMVINNANGDGYVANGQNPLLILNETGVSIPVVSFRKSAALKWGIAPSVDMAEFDLVDNVNARNNIAMRNDGTVNFQSGYGIMATNRVSLTADWTCGTAQPVTTCASATIIGSGGGVPLTFTLPSQSGLSWHWQCDGVVGQATAATANSWNFITATNGATNVTASYDMYTAATAKAGGATTDQASTTSTVVIGPTWTLGGTATKMPFHIAGQVEGASASGTVLSLQIVAPTPADVITIYRGATCTVGF